MSSVLIINNITNPKLIVKLIATFKMAINFDLMKVVNSYVYVFKFKAKIHSYQFTSKIHSYDINR